jgi:hypothetical protein
MYRWERALRSVATIPVPGPATFVEYVCHASSLTTGAVDLVFILFIAFPWEIVEHVRSLPRVRGARGTVWWEYFVLFGVSY